MPRNTRVSYVMYILVVLWNDDVINVLKCISVLGIVGGADYSSRYPPPLPHQTIALLSRLFGGTTITQCTDTL